MIPFNKPFLTGRETDYIKDAVLSGKISGNGKYTQKCQDYFQNHYGFKKVLLTTSCTDALEMCAILANIKPGDEVIIPSYTFVSTALAFIRQGAKIVFADSGSNNPNLDVSKIEQLITSKTVAIVPVHYAGVACDMDEIMKLSEKYNLFVIEDAAQAIDSYFIDKTGNRKPLGSIGHMSAFSFHETKNIIAGEGGMLVVNDERYVKRAEIIWEKGTNRAEFFRGEINKYGWVDVGSSFLPSEIIAAFLWAQIENIDNIQTRRKHLWSHYYHLIENKNLSNFVLPKLPDYATNNGHMFYLQCKSLEHRNQVIKELRDNGYHAVFHYLSLHKSEFYMNKHDGRILANSDNFENCLLRLPLFYELDFKDIENIVDILLLA